MMILILKVLVLILIIASVIITLFNMPGHWLLFTGILIFSLIEGFISLSAIELLILFGITLFLSVVDTLSMLLGAKRFDSTKAGMIGATLGAFIGLILGSFVGMMIGAFIGATLFEMVFAQKAYRIAIKSGIGTTIGLFVSIILRFVILISVAGWIIVEIF